MKSPWRLFLLGWLIILSGSLLAHLIQTSGDVEIKDVRFTGNNGQTLSALLYIPPNASARTPAPGILAVHGYINSREVQAPFAIELARRGYVVLALDQSGHGYSDGPAFSNGFGGPAALRYLRSLDIVDNENIGLEGHSMGGWTVLAAAAAMPDAYRSMVLQGSSTGSGMAAPGTPEWPRNVSVVFAQFDEFAPLMWEVPRGSEIADSGKLKTLFGTDSRVDTGRVYGSIEQGNARVLHNPPVTHPGNHISHTAVQHTIDWFAQTLDHDPIEGPSSRNRQGQIWFFKELGTLAAFVGFIVMILGAIRGLLTTSTFSPLAQPANSAAWPVRNTRWWLLAVISAIIPVVTFYPFMRMGAGLLSASSFLPQGISNQVMFWAVANALILTGLGFVVKAEKVGFSVISLRSRGVLALLFALSTVLIGYSSLLLADYFFKVDFRFWFVGLKLLSLDQFQTMLVYLIPFTLFFILSLRALHGGLSVAGDSRRNQYVSNASVMAGGFVVFLLAQYGSLFIGGRLLTPAEPLNTIVMIQFAPLLLMVSVISTCAWRHTGSYLPGALINGMWVSWYIVAGQASQAV
ncbi:MAG: alpha/beta fold hydrolase [Pseudohongiella sp.]|nr:alpha/beta fold hydrolase [Pseudohongiella sp.]MDO9521257.1 alpha/beta fold hydrolase [Pseudohongiella sp.]MDP2127286.1 alpha/beta fold hydrolase [Pseudohongiella sp.]